MKFDEQRKLINCPHFEQCSGCQYEMWDELPIYKRARQFFLPFGIYLPFIQADPNRWRVRAKLAARSNGKIQIGLFEKGTHNVLSIPNCQVQHLSINEVTSRISKAISLESLSIYNETTFLGDLRYIQLIVQRVTKKVQLSVVLNKHSLGPWQGFLEHFFRNNTDILHSIWVNFNEQKSNTIFSKSWLHLFGDRFLWEEIQGVKMPFLPSHFGQANLTLFEKLLHDISSWVDPNSHIVELYSGSGTIGLTLLDKAKKLILSEREVEAKNTFEEAAKKLTIEQRDKIEFITGCASDQINLLTEADCIIVDPPRKGLDDELIKALLNKKTAAKLIYISCSFESFQEDAKAILSEGSWKLEKALSYLFFPGTDHIELVALFSQGT